MRTTVIAGFFTFYYWQHTGSCFIGPFDCITALLGYVLPSLNLPSGLGSPESPAGSVYLAVIASCPASIGDDLSTLQATSTNCIFHSKTFKHRCSPGDLWVFSLMYWQQVLLLPNIHAWRQLVHPTGFHPKWTKVPFKDLLKIISASKPVSIQIKIFHSLPPTWLRSEWNHQHNPSSHLPW